VTFSLAPPTPNEQGTDLALCVRRDAGGRSGIHYYSVKLEVLDPIEAKGYCLVLRKRTR
jgi:hypothetical protein